MSAYQLLPDKGTEHNCLPVFDCWKPAQTDGPGRARLGLVRIACQRQSLLDLLWLCTALLQTLFLLTGSVFAPHFHISLIEEDGFAHRPAPLPALDTETCSQA